MFARAPIISAVWMFGVVAAVAQPGPGAAQQAGNGTERLFARGLLSEKKGDYWQALRDAEAVLRADPGSVAAQRLRRTAGYEAHYREALRLIDSGRWNAAADQLENARVYGSTPALSAKLRLVHTHLVHTHLVQTQLVQTNLVQTNLLRTHLAPTQPVKAAEHRDLDTTQATALAALNDYLGSVNQALAAADWNLVDQRIRQLPAAVEPAPPAVRYDLLPSFRLYAEGHAGEARVAAKLVAAQLMAARQSDEAAQSFLSFLNSRARHEKLPALLGLLSAMYAAALMLGLYFGLRREVRCWAA
jgi:hypothetical protein